MIMKTPEHPWGHFLWARKMVIEWLINETKQAGDLGYIDYHKISEILSMDPMQVQLIHMTEVEK